ncbi:MAG: hypothetical protein AB4041_07265 [Microcystaceae cyanobacterium]
MMISSSTYPTPRRKLTLASSESVEHNTEDNKETKVSSPSVEEEATSDLPEPDSDNITVLTDKLPNKPILPWNRYDSPWEEGEEASGTENASDPEAEQKEGN